MERVFVGMDIHARSVTASAIDGQGSVIAENKFPASVGVLLNAMQRFDKPTIVMETGRGYHVWYDLFKEQGYPVQVANTFKVRLIAENKKKDDRQDARHLAQLARTGFLPTVWVPPKPVRELRRLLLERLSFVQKRTAIKNRIRYIAHLKRLDLGIEFLFSRRSLNKLLDLEIPELSRCIRIISVLNDEIADIDKELDEKSSQFAKDMGLLRTIPGIGRISALALIAEIGDVRRFSKPKKLCSYAGLVPAMRTSGETLKAGSITRQGSRMLRHVLTEAAHTAVRYDCSFRSVYDRIRARRGDKRAIVAIARKLLIASWDCLTHQRTYTEGLSAIKVGNDRHHDW